MKKRDLVIGGVYRHFKGGEYLVLTLALDSETLEEIVVYITLYHNPEKETRVWTRPLKDFMGTKILENGDVINRFELVSKR